MQDVPESVAPVRVAAPGSEPEGAKRAAARSRLALFLDSDLLHSFLRSKIVVVAAVLSVDIAGAAFLAPLIEKHDPYKLKAISLIDGNTPPA